MDFKRLRRLLNQIVIVGKTKKTFFRKSKKFELQIYFTSDKNKIMIINIAGVEINHPKLFIDFNVGDDVKKVISWIEKYNHEIIFERNRSQN